MRSLAAVLTTSGLVLAVLTGGPGWAQVRSDEGRLQAINQSINQETSAPGQTTQVQVLAKEFNVSSSVVEGLRGQKQGWGEVTIELAMAQHLAQTDPTTYPTLSAALTKIESLRSERMGWGKIANDLGFKLGPVVSAAERTRGDLLRELHTGQAQSVQRPERLERLDRPERPQRPERPEVFHHR